MPLIKILTRKFLGFGTLDNLAPEGRVELPPGLEVELQEGPVQDLAHPLPGLQHVVCTKKITFFILVFHMRGKEEDTVNRST